MPRSYISRTPSLLQQLFYHAQRNVVALRNLLTCSVPTVVRRHNAFSEII